MLFLITLTPPPVTFPTGAGGREVLQDKPENVLALKIVVGYGAYTEHT